VGIPTSQNPNTPKGLESRLSVKIQRILVELPRSSYEEGSQQAGRPSRPQSLTTVLTRLRLATTLRMRVLEVESPKYGASSHFHRRGVFIGPWGSSTDLENLVWYHVVADRPSHVVGRPGGAVSTDFLHRLGLLLLV
jgi:hypothetical protein